MLGKYNQDGVSYIKAAGNKHTYFDLGDKGWNEALNKVGVEYVGNKQKIFRTAITARENFLSFT